jgi:hypothetical protein
MDEIKRIDRKNIKFEYADNTLPNKDWEHARINQINLWFGEFAYTINKQEGTIVAYFQDELNNRLYFDKVDEELQAVLYKHLSKFQPPHNQQQDNPGM